MLMRSPIRLICSLGLAALLVVPATVNAQYKKYTPTNSSDRATGERYHIELSAGFWNPAPSLVISSEQLGLIGTNIDAMNDLGMTQAKFKEFRIVLRPAKKHKFTLDYIPISYSADAHPVPRRIVFNGIAYNIGLPVTSSLDWGFYNISYEYDFIYRSRGYFGMVLQAKYTDVEVQLQSPINKPEYAHARAPIPAIGATARVYPVANLSITGTFTGFKLPESIDKERRYSAKYLDFDVYGTFNLTNNFGVQGGYRALTVNYRAKSDTGDMQLKGPYFGAVVRF